jgi:hypothetical protein
MTIATIAMMTGQRLRTRERISPRYACRIEPEALHPGG